MLRLIPIRSRFRTGPCPPFQRFKSYVIAETATNSTTIILSFDVQQHDSPSSPMDSPIHGRTALLRPRPIWRIISLIRLTHARKMKSSCCSTWTLSCYTWCMRCVVTAGSSFNWGRYAEPRMAWHQKACRHHGWLWHTDVCQRIERIIKIWIGTVIQYQSIV